MNLSNAIISVMKTVNIKSIVQQPLNIILSYSLS